MKTAFHYLKQDQRAAVAAAILVLVTQVIILGSLVRDAVVSGLIS